MVDGFFAGDPDASPLRRGNFMARQRMAVLYDRSVTWGGLVVGTGNKTESLIGYTTVFGDNACAFNPIGDLYKSQVRQLAAAIGVPDPIIRKAPSADLWPGQTDEVESGFTYPELDRLLFWRIDRRRSVDEIDRARLRAGVGGPGGPHGRSGRVQAAGPADRQARSADGGGRLPVSAAATRVRTRVTARTPARPGPARSTSSRRRSAISATSPIERSRSSRAVPLIAAEDTRLTRRLLDRYAIETRLTSFHARSDPEPPGGARGAPAPPARTWPSSPMPGRRSSATRAPIS